MGARQAWARRCSYWLEPKNWLIVTVVLIGWHADGRAGIGWGLLAALFTAVLPTLFISYGIRHGRWSDRNVGARRPRLAVLAFSAGSVAAGLILLAVGGAPHLLTGYLAFMLASVALLAAVTTVWKISIHCAVASGSVVILALSFGPLVWPAYALVALLGWSRVALKEHTVAQVIVGSVLGAGAAAVAYAVLVSLASANTGCDAAAQADRTTVRGQAAWARPMTRSASPACPAPVASSSPNQVSRANSTAMAAAAVPGRSAHGTPGPRRRAPIGQLVSRANPMAARMKCGTEPKPPPSCSGLAATSRPATAPTSSITRPGMAAGRSASAVTTSQSPTTANVSVITHRSVAPIAASELTVSATGSNRGCRSAAAVHPLTSRTGDAADETTPHHGTSRTPLR
jgi:membrane-associated phospholipid phosphatase